MADLYELLRADAKRAAARAGNNPWKTPDSYPRPAHRDPTAEQAIARVEKERRRKDPLAG